MATTLKVGANVAPSLQQQAKAIQERGYNPYLPPTVRPTIVLKAGQTKTIQLQPQNSQVPAPIRDVYNKVYNAIDTYSGGKLTDAKLNAMQNELNNQVTSFNNIYQNRSLTGAEAIAAGNMSNHLNSMQNAIDIARAGEKNAINTILKNPPRVNSIADLILATSRLRNTTYAKNVLYKRASATVGAEMALAGAAVSLVQLPGNIKNIVTNPANIITGIKNIPSQIKQYVVNSAQLIKVSPYAGVAKIFTDAGVQYVAFKATDAGLKVTGTLAKRAVARISPYFKGVAKTGTVIELVGEKGTSLNLKVVGKIPKESIASQLGRAGKTVDAVSSQADRLVGLIQRGKVIRKPIGEAEKSLSSVAKTLLKKFDRGIIKSRELVDLDAALRKAGSKGILERSFFADPNLRIRPSRLGVKSTEEATLSDVFKGNVRFKSPKPQILLFEKVQVENFPKSLSSVIKKIKAGRTLTRDESEKLLSYQLLDKSGQFKPLGFQTRESEITLAPGEIVRRVKKIGTIEVDKKIIPIIKTKVVQATNLTKKLLKKLEKGTIKSSELKTLGKRLDKETGFKGALSSSYKAGTKYVPLSRYVAGSGIKLLSKVSSRKGVSKVVSRKITSPTSRLKPSPSIVRRYGSSSIKYTSTGRPYIITTSGTPRFVPTKSPPPSRTPNYKYPGKVPGRPPIPPPRYPKYKPSGSKSIKKIVGGTSPNIQKEMKKLAGLTFNVYGKARGKFFKLNKRPLNFVDARSRGAYVSKHTTSRTFKLTPVGKRKPAQIKSKEKGFFNKVDYMFREYKIRNRKSIKTPLKYIKKTKYSITTADEKRHLALAKFLKQERKRR